MGSRYSVTLKRDTKSGAFDEPHPASRGCEARISAAVRVSVEGEIPQARRHSTGQGKGRTCCMGSEGPETLRTSKGSKRVDLTQREADALAEIGIGGSRRSTSTIPAPNGYEVVRYELCSMAVEAGDREAGEADFDDPEVLNEADTRARASQFLTDRGIALIQAGRTRFLSALVREFFAATKLWERRAPGDWGPDQHLDQLAPSPTLSPL
jgi:hypothetical protein